MSESAHLQQQRQARAARRGSEGRARRRARRRALRGAFGLCNTLPGPYTRTVILVLPLLRHLDLVLRDLDHGLGLGRAARHLLAGGARQG